MNTDTPFRTTDQPATAARWRLRLRVSLYAIAVTQLVFGLVFLIPDQPVADLLGLRPPAPHWANWLLTMMAARFLGYATGMFAAARAPQRHLAWINTMIVVQVIDWVATVAYLAAGVLTLRQVSTAAILPPLFIAGLLWWNPGRDRYRDA
jgi:hypothetical protein